MLIPEKKKKNHFKSAPKNVLHPSFTMLIEFGFENTPVKYICDLLKHIVESSDCALCCWWGEMPLVVLN